jgi:hypothetical protein
LILFYLIFFLAKGLDVLNGKPTNLVNASLSLSKKMFHGTTAQIGYPSSSDGMAIAIARGFGVRVYILLSYPIF